MSNFNWVDYILIAIFIFSIMSGLARGLVKELVSLITLIAAFFIATMFSSPLAATFTSSQSVQNLVTSSTTTIGVNTAQPVSFVALGLSFALLFAGTVIVGAIVSYIVNIAFQAGILGIGNRILGGVFGFARGFLLNLVLIFIVQFTPVASNASWSQSQLVNDFQPAVVWLGNIVSPTLANLKDRLGNTVTNMGSTIQNISNQYSR